MKIFGSPLKVEKKWLKDVEGVSSSSCPVHFPKLQAFGTPRIQIPSFEEAMREILSFDPLAGKASTPRRGGLGEGSACWTSKGCWYSDVLIGSSCSAITSSCQSLLKCRPSVFASFFLPCFPWANALSPWRASSPPPLPAAWLRVWVAAQAGASDLGCQGSSSWWWWTMAKRHLALCPKIWTQGLCSRMASCLRTCCPKIWIQGLCSRMASCQTIWRATTPCSGWTQEIQKVRLWGIWTCNSDWTRSTLRARFWRTWTCALVRCTCNSDDLRVDMWPSMCIDMCRLVDGVHQCTWTRTAFAVRKKKNYFTSSDPHHDTYLS